jgi:hypothetical protein
MKLKDIKYEGDFYWKGKRYRQVIRPKVMPRKCIIVCCITKDPCADWVDMPAGREVKPVLKHLTK